MKSIRYKSDLAINGAPPAFAQALHVGRPNVGSKDAFLKYIDGIFERNWLTNNGPLVQEFEQRVADLHEVKHCVSMTNGTIALEIAIRALELKGEVIVPSYTFIATAHALHWQGIVPIFADVDPVTHNIDPSAVRRMITPMTSGIIGVHLWGRGAPVQELQSIADDHDLKLLFDAAHAFGCSLDGSMIGSFGACEVLSFHATKFFNSFEGGAILTNSDILADKVRLMRNFGFSGFDNVIHPGTNGKMIEVSAAMGLVNLDSIGEVINVNYENYKAYQRALSDIPDIKLLTFDEEEHNNFQYVVIEVEETCPASRDQIVDALHAENILARRYFWPGCHMMEPYCSLYPHAGLMLEKTNRLAERVIVLPSGSAINCDIAELISTVIRVVVAGSL